jgi:hypothetical protein
MEKIKSIVDVAYLNTANTELTPKLNLANTITDYIPFGSDNLFPQAMALFARMSPNHRGVINSKRRYVLGNGLKTDDKEFEGFLNVCNLDGESLSDVISKIELDYEIGGNAYLEIIKDNKNRFIYFNHIDFTKCRKSKENDEIYINPDWCTSLYDSENTIEIPLYPNFKNDEDNPQINRSIYHIYDYEPEFYYYGIPNWIAAKDAVQLDIKTNRFNLARLINTFKVSGIMFVPVKDQSESAEVIKRLKSDYTGDLNQDKLLVLTKSRSADGEKAEQVQLIQNQTEEKGSWIELHNLSISDIISGHSWFRSLSGIADNTGFDTQRILNEYNIALSSFIIPRQNKIKGIIQKIFKTVLNKEIDFEFINREPISSSDGMYLWEYRKSKGLEFDENDIKQQKIIYNGSLID